MTKSIKYQIQSYLRKHKVQPFHYKKLAEILGLNPITVNFYLNQLVNEGEVELYKEVIITPKRGYFVLVNK